jgi:sarcosine oxidase/L-pipecolate oxidase
VYANKSFQNDLNLGASLTPFSSCEEVCNILPDAVATGALFETGKGYHNANGGWAAASKAMDALLENVRRLGARVEAGLKMKDLLLDDGNPQRVKGVLLEGGESIDADLIILAMGAWTPSVLSRIPGIDVNWNECLVATG